jgi:SAM-dependent methyltransferase
VMAKPDEKLAVSVADTASSRTIEYLSQPAAVSMADAWFEIASADHFWIRRRFQVLRKLAGQFIATAREMAEIGCGNGLLQREIEEAYHREVTGFDLNEYALRKNVSLRSRVCCYDILEKNANLRSRYDVIFLFDVLEHIAEEDPFLQAVLFHLKPSGKLIINVPAGEWAFSAYDTAAGHVRRYSIATLSNSLRRNDMHPIATTYWGLPLVPTLALRKLWLMGKQDSNQIISTGFDSRSRFLNGVLAALSTCETLPQQLLGTSVMAVFSQATQSEPRSVQA